MNKAIREILSQIDMLKSEAKNLVLENKLEEAETVKAKILDLREKEISLRAEYKSDYDNMQNSITTRKRNGVEDMENTINRAIKNAIYPNEKIADETVKIFLNASRIEGNIGKGLRKLLDYINTGIPGDEFTEELEKEIKNEE